MIKLTNENGEINVDFQGKFEDVIKELGSSLTFLFYDIAEKSNLEPYLLAREFIKQYKKVLPKLVDKIKEYKTKDNV